MSDYCKCKDQQPEEIKRGVIVCQNCKKEIDPGDLAQDEDDFSTCEDLVPDTSAKYENSQCASQTGEPSYEFGVR